MLKLKLQYFDHLMQRTDSLEKTPMLGKTEGRRRGRQTMRWLDGITNSTEMSFSELRKVVIDRDCSMPGFPSFTISQSLLKLMSIEPMMPSNHLILCHPLLLPPNLSKHQGLFQ